MITKKLSLFMLFLALLALLLTGCGGRAPAQPPAQPPVQNGSEPVEEPTPEKAVALIETLCIRCHNLNRVYQERDKELWPDIVTRMVNKSPGLLTNEEYSLVVEYLQENYGK